jgi:hypothetical protein
LKFELYETDPLFYFTEVNGGGGAANLSVDDLQFRPPAPETAGGHYQTQAADLSLAGGPPDSHHHHHPDMYGGLGLRYSGGGGNSPPTLAAHHQLYEDSFYTATASADTSMDQVNYCRVTVERIEGETKRGWVRLSLLLPLLEYSVSDPYVFI